MAPACLSRLITSASCCVPSHQHPYLRHRNTGGITHVFDNGVVQSETSRGRLHAQFGVGVYDVFDEERDSVQGSEGFLLTRRDEYQRPRLRLVWNCMRLGLHQTLSARQTLSQSSTTSLWETSR